MTRHVNINKIGHVGHQLTRVAACVRYIIVTKYGVRTSAKS